MKIEMLVEDYSAVNGLRLKGAGIHDVPNDKAKYLLSTFPDWFQAVDQVEEQIDDTETSSLDANVDSEEGERPEVADEQPEVAEDPEPAGQEVVQELEEEQSPTDEESPAVDEQPEVLEETASEEVETAGDPQTEESPAESEAPEATQEEAEVLTPTKPLSKMNKTELQALGSEIGIELTEDMTADQMREAIKAAQETK